MTAKDYLIALKVVREIQRKQTYSTGRAGVHLARTLQDIEMYCPLDFSSTCGRLIKDKMLESFSGNLF